MLDMDITVSPARTAPCAAADLRVYETQSLNSSGRSHMSLTGRSLSCLLDIPDSDSPAALCSQREKSHGKKKARSRGVAGDAVGNQLAPGSGTDHPGGVGRQFRRFSSFFWCPQGAGYFALIGDGVTTHEGARRSHFRQASATMLIASARTAPVLAGLRSESI